MSTRMETASNRRTGWRGSVIPGDIWEIPWRDKGPFKGRTLWSEILVPKVVCLGRRKRRCVTGHHLWVSARHAVWLLLLHAAQVPGSRPHLHALSGCFCYHRSMRRVHDLPQVGIPRNASVRSTPSQPALGMGQERRQDKRLQTVTVNPFLLNRSTPTVSVPHGGLGGGDGYENQEFSSSNVTLQGLNLLVWLSSKKSVCIFSYLLKADSREHHLTIRLSEWTGNYTGNKLHSSFTVHTECWLELAAGVCLL